MSELVPNSTTKYPEGVVIDPFGVRGSRSVPGKSTVRYG